MNCAHFPRASGWRAYSGFLLGELVHFVDTDCLGEEGGDSDFLARSVLSAANSLRARGDWKLSGLPAALTSGRDRPGAVGRISATKVRFKTHCGRKSSASTSGRKDSGSRTNSDCCHRTPRMFNGVRGYRSPWMQVSSTIRCSPREQLQDPKKEGQASDVEGGSSGLLNPGSNCLGLFAVGSSMMIGSSRIARAASREVFLSASDRVSMPGMRAMIASI